MPTKTLGAIPVVRGCGTRTKGAAYVEVGMAVDGHPLADFLVCPPHVVDPSALGLSPIGMAAIERQGVTHLVDWIGEAFYPNICDFIEEAALFGVSRKLNVTKEIADKLTTDSRLLCVHRKASWPAEPEKLRTFHKCGKHDSTEPPDIPHGCVNYFWQDLVDCQPTPPHVAGARATIRYLPSLKYDGFTALPKLGNYRPAIFASFPITRIVIVDNPGSGNPTLDKFVDCSLPVEVVNA